jgi:K+-sensing histidine kinase KdpD
MGMVIADREKADDWRMSPWYRLQPGTAIVVAMGLFVAISVLQWFNNESGQAIAVLYVLPIALLAVTLGERGGLMGAMAGFVLFAAFAIEHGRGDIDATGWAVRAIAMFLLGDLVGRATDQTTASECAALAEQERRCRVEEANRRYTDALEIHDSLLQQMVAAKWILEKGQPDHAAELLTETIAAGERMIAGLLPTRVSRPADLPLAVQPGGNVLAQYRGEEHGPP